MTLSQIVGAFILSIPFVGIIGCAAIKIGLVILIPLGVAALTILCIAVGVHLLIPPYEK
tara:strand:- start:8343 stop:8519 length:177 start_codon:yes stop_codon:yes gene_type:complete